MNRGTPSQARRTTEVEQEIRLLLRRGRALFYDWASLVSPGLTPTEYAALVSVHESGELRASDVADRLRLDKSTVSRLVGRLVELGLVEVAPDDRDGRARLLRVTPAGDRWIASARDEQHKRLLASFATWPEEDLDQLVRLLRRLNADLSS